VGVRSVTPLFGYLGKSGSKTNTPDEGDTKLTIPGILQPVMEVPYPVLALYNAPLPGGNTPVNSFMLYDEILFNVNSGVVLFPLGPGLWDFDFLLTLRPFGAVQDGTCSYRIELLDTLTAVSINLGRLVNDGTRPQQYRHHWRQLITSEQAYTVTRTTLIGAGTGTNFAHFIAKCTRLF
jgi:hypothetical protein